MAHLQLPRDPDGISLHLEIFGEALTVTSESHHPIGLLRETFAHFVSDRPSGANGRWRYRITPSENGWNLTRDGEPIGRADDDYTLLYTFEKDLTIALQYQRPELLFIHAAALEWGGGAVLLIAPSGSGKSTTAWGLLQRGLRYLSDELAPVDLQTLEVLPYPHALCLKSPPPPPFTLPAETLATRHTLHVPTRAFANQVVSVPTPLAALLFLRYDPCAPVPTMRPMSSGLAAAQIYSNALNLLAHQRHGLEAVSRVASHTACFELVSADLEQTCMLVESQLAAGPGRSLALGLPEGA